MKNILCTLMVSLLGGISVAQLNVGDNVPNFSLVNANGKLWNFKENLKQQPMVIYFYPAALTGGCTKQACSYRDMINQDVNTNFSVVGISGDDYLNLQLFKDKYHLNFTLLSDSNGEVAKLFGVALSSGGEIKRVIGENEFVLKRNVTTGRWTFVVNGQGKVIYVKRDVNVNLDWKNVKEVLEK